MVRTMELILGTNPLSQFDANAVPMWRLFHAGGDLRPYRALPETVGMTALNTAASAGAAQSAAWNFDTEDQAPMDQLNQVIWHAVKGTDAPYPGQADSQPLTADRLSLIRRPGRKVAPGLRSRHRQPRRYSPVTARPT